MDARPSFSNAIEEAAASLDRPVDADRSMRDFAEVARSSIPDFDHASITLLRPGGRFETGASTSPLSQRLDAVQYAAGEGPCLDAVRSGRPVSVPGLRSERRWPAYVSAAVALGVTSHLSVRLHLDDEDARAGLNLYSTRTDQVTLQAEAMAGLFGSFAVSGSRPAVAPTRPGPSTQPLDVIGEALGIVMDRSGVDANRAFDSLATAATRAGVPLAVHSQQLVDHARSS
jgi:hypothetical protein